MRTMATLAAVLVAATAATGPSGAATSGTIVGATVPSATTLNASGCAPGVVGRTDFGSIMPGSSAVTSDDCTITFGSSNDIGRLRLSQSDGAGQSMHQASRGAYDTSFAVDGTTTLEVGGLSSTPLAIRAQEDGKVVVGGYCMTAANGYDFCVARFEEDGDLDSATFNATGWTTTSFGAGTASDTLEDLVVQPDGKIVAVGECAMGAVTGTDVCFARYQANGQLDPTFSGDGKLTVAIAPGSGADYIEALALQPDGGIVAAGDCSMGGSTGRDACAVRLTSTGALDTTFSGDGIATIAVPGSSMEAMRGVVLQPDGSVVTGGMCNMGGATGRDACLVAFTSGGMPDTTFSGDGIATASFFPSTGSENPYTLAGDGRGGLLLLNWCSGSGSPTGTDMCLARFDAAGALVTSFSGDGLRELAIADGTGSDYGSSAVLQPDGMVVVAGYCWVDSNNSFNACIARLDATGALDPTFDDDGYRIDKFSPVNYDDYTEGLALGKDGTLLVATDCGDAADDPLCVGRLGAGGTFDQYTASNDWDAGSTGMFGVCLSGVTTGTATWTAGGTCPVGNAAWWNALPTTPVQVAVADANAANASARFRFGLRASPSQAPGAYQAPITFDVLAP